MTQTVVITGGNKGIGKAIVFAFAQKGYNVVFSLRDVKQADPIVKEVEKLGVKCFAVKADVSKEEDVKNLVNEAVKKFGKIDVHADVFGGGGPPNDTWHQQELAESQATLADCCYRLF